MTFLVLKPDYPHGSASNSLFSVKKGEILECPASYTPSNSFQVCDTRDAAEEYIKLAYTESFPTAERKQEDKVERGTPPYPLFRKVSGLGGEEATYQLFSRDIHRFLSREEKEILLDIKNINMHLNTATKILDYERLHFTRKAIIDILEAIIKKSDSEKEEKRNKEMLHA
jgi:hypothetical protein